jgi:Cellulase (glycosyl hydrolase family 5)
VQRLKLRDGYFRKPSGAPVYLLGANFWPKRSGPWMYRDPWNPQAVGADLAEVATLGANVVRIFCFTPDFMPAADVVSADALDRLAQTIDLAARAGMWSIPTFLVGHMSGENWDTPWCGGRDWYTDPMLLDASELLIGTVASHFAGDPRIAAWLLSNEWPLFAGRTSNEAGLRWARRLCGTLRAADPGCNVSLGDGSWDVINGQHSGLPSGDLTAVVDFFGPHFYPKETDALRHSAFPSFAMRMLQPLHHPVLLEEFGCSSDQADDAYAAAYYRTVLWSSFGAGNCGALFWNSHDFTLADRPPYSHHPYELHFGVIRSDGSRKPQADEVARFAAFLAKHDCDEWQRETPALAIGRTSYYLQAFPFDWGWSKPELRDLYLQTFTSCLSAGLDAGFADLSSPIPRSTKLLVVPCLQQITTQDTTALESFVREGGVLYMSYGGEPWFPDLGDFIGARPLIRYGLVESTIDPLCLTFACDFGDLTRGSELHFTVSGELRRRAPLVCEPRDATVLATDQNGRPALLERELGAGRIVFSTHPLEYYALNGLDANCTDETPLLYRALARAAELPRALADGVFVQSFAWRAVSAATRRRILFVNHAWQSTEIVVHTAGETIDVESGERDASPSIRLGPKEVRVVDVVLDPTRIATSA